MKKLTFHLVAMAFILCSCIPSTFPSKHIINDCLQIQTSSSYKGELSGTLIFSFGDLIRFQDHGLSLGKLMLSDNKYNIVINNIHVSPDREKVIFLEDYYDKSTSAFISEHLDLIIPNHPVQEIANWMQLGNLVTWFDNEWLLFSPANDIQGTIILMNPFTGENRKIRPSFPDIYSLAPLPTWYYGENPLPLYDPTLSTAFYLREKSSGMYFTLWNANRSQILWQQRTGNPMNEPKWSPDGNTIVFSMQKTIASPYQDELFSLDRQEGNETQLTNLSGDFNTVHIGLLSWSPDGKEIAFWLDARKNKNDNGNPMLAVLDLQEKQVVNYCIGIGGTAPVWSPDGHQIALAIQKDSKSEVVIIDLPNHNAMSIDQNTIPVGWLK
jgi:hypothetical protein